MQEFCQALGNHNLGRKSMREKRFDCAALQGSGQIICSNLSYTSYSRKASDADDS
jgi:hypothetical protein